MDNLTHEHLLATLEKIGTVLVEQGFQKGSFQIGFNPKSLDEKLTSLQGVKQTSEEAPIITPQFECHFGGCGMICCTF